MGIADILRSGCVCSKCSKKLTGVNESGHIWVASAIDVGIGENCPKITCPDCGRGSIFVGAKIGGF